MSAEASTTFDWAGEERISRLTYKEIEALQLKLTVYAKDPGGNLLLNKHGNAAVAYSGAIARVFDRIANDGWLQDDIRETIRQGLIGGGMAPSAASRLIAENCAPPYKHETIMAAAQILITALKEGAADPPPKQRAAKKKKKATAPVASASAA